MFAVATLLYNAKYLPGALVLGHVLRKIATENIKLVVLIDKAEFSSWQLELLSENWDNLVDTQVSASTLKQKLNDALKRPELAKTYTKIELWRLPYEKVLYLDADVLPLEGYNLVTDLLKIDYPKGKILAAPDSGFPDIFNSGVFALTPDKEDYENLLKIVQSNDVDASFDGADQGLLNQYFNPNPDWVARLLQAGNTDLQAFDRVQHSNWIPIPFLYNTTPNAQYQYYPASNHFGYPGNRKEEVDKAPRYSKDGENRNSSCGQEPGNLPPYENTALEQFSNSTRAQVSVIHYIGPVKPWNNQNSAVFDKWWLQWYEYSGGKPIDVLLRLQKYPIVVNTLKRTAASVVHRTEIKIPADLCDPSNYQHLPSHDGKSEKVWDATKEAPPRNAPKRSSFYLPQKSRHNNWDDDKVKKEPQQVHSQATSKPGPVSTKPRAVPRKGILKNKTTDAGQKKIDTFGVHTEQIPDRVFNEQSDYTPNHILMMTDRRSLFGGPSSRSATQEPLPCVEDLRNSLSKSTINGKAHEPKKEKKLLIGGSDTAGTDKEHIPSKIFPWEFRDNIPERVWE